MYAKLLCLLALFGFISGTFGMGRFKLRKFCEGDDSECMDAAKRCHGEKPTKEMMDSMRSQWQDKIAKFNECLTENDQPPLGSESDPEDDEDMDQETQTEGDGENTEQNERRGGRPGGFGRGGGRRANNGERGGPGGRQGSRSGAFGRGGHCGGGSLGPFNIWRRLETIEDGEVAKAVQCCFAEKTGKTDGDGNLNKEKVLEMIKMKFPNDPDEEVITAYEEAFDQCSSDFTDCDFKAFKDCMMKQCVETLKG